MRLKTAKDTTDVRKSHTCREALIRGGFEPWMSNHRWLRLGGENKPGEVYDVWFHRYGYIRDWFVEIHKGTVMPASKTSVGFVFWDWANTIILRLV